LLEVPECDKMATLKILHKVLQKRSSDPEFIKRLTVDVQKLNIS